VGGIEPIEPRPTWIAPVERERPEHDPRERREEREREEREQRARAERERRALDRAREAAAWADDESGEGRHVDVRA
jgi:hypothetical protein